MILLFLTHAIITVLSGTVAAQPAPQQILEEINALRREPPRYARKIELLLPYYRGSMLRLPGEAALQTTEGISAARKAIAALRSQRPVPELRLSAELTRDAAAHVRDIGPKGLVTHDGSDGSTPMQRAHRQSKVWTGVGENITFGPGNARAVVIDLLIDDGVAGRGHRANLLAAAWRAAGIACGPHARYRIACVIDLAFP